MFQLFAFNLLLINADHVQEMGHYIYYASISYEIISFPVPLTFEIKVFSSNAYNYVLLYLSSNLLLYPFSFYRINILVAVGFN